MLGPHVDDLLAAFGPPPEPPGRLTHPAVVDWLHEVEEWLEEPALWQEAGLRIRLIAEDDVLVPILEEWEDEYEVPLPLPGNEAARLASRSVAMAIPDELLTTLGTLIPQLGEELYDNLAICLAPPGDAPPEDAPLAEHIRWLVYYRDRLEGGAQQLDALLGAHMEELLALLRQLEPIPSPDPARWPDRPHEILQGCLEEVAPGGG